MQEVFLLAICEVAAASRALPAAQKAPGSLSVYKHDQARNLPKSLRALPKGLLNRCMPQKCVCPLILFGLKDYGEWVVQLVRSFRRGRGVWRRDWKEVMWEPVKLLA